MRDRQLPDDTRIITKLERRISALESRLSKVIDERRLPILFSFHGPLSNAVGVESPPWRAIHPTEIDLAVPQVNVAPSGGDLTIDLKMDGSVVRTLTVPDGAFYVEDALPFIVPAGSSLTATVTADSGAEDLAVPLLPKLL